MAAPTDATAITSPRGRASRTNMMATAQKIVAIAKVIAMPTPIVAGKRLPPPNANATPAMPRPMIAPASSSTPAAIPSPNAA